VARLSLYALAPPVTLRYTVHCDLCP